MISRLRLRLAVLYLSVATVLMVLLIGAMYGLVRYYFESSVLLDLQRRMAHEFRERHLSLPAELEQANQMGQVTPRTPQALPEGNDNKPTLSLNATDAYADEAITDTLAAITVLVVDQNGNRLAPINGPATQRTSHQPAIDAALAHGNDHQVIQTSSGSRVSLLTYYLGNGAAGNKPLFLQLSRSLTDQDHILTGLATGLLLLGASSVVLLGMASWWWSGHSIRSAQQTWEMQQRFVANANHELRTPLTIIRADAETLQQNFADGLYDTDDNLFTLDDLVNKCDHTTHLISNLLLLSRADAHSLTPRFRTIALSDLVHAVEQEAFALSKKHNVHFRIKSELDSYMVWGDSEYIQRVLLTLLDNAFRYTSPGGIVTLSVEHSKNTTQVIVSDTGNGISSTDLPHVFERFYQVDAAHSTAGTSGLGLSIAKALVEVQGGKISLNSQPGVGTQAVVTLPQHPKQTPTV